MCNFFLSNNFPCAIFGTMLGQLTIHIATETSWFFWFVCFEISITALAFCLFAYAIIRRIEREKED
jgi:hypothetical protein